MKSSISLPDDLFRKLDTEAKRRGISRSRLISLSLAAYFEDRGERRRRQKLEAALDAALDEVESELPDEVKAYQVRRLAESPETEW